MALVSPPQQGISRLTEAPRPRTRASPSVSRQALAHGVYDGIPLLLVVYELALILGADVEQSAMADDTLLGAVEVTVGDLKDGDLLQLNLQAWKMDRLACCFQGKRKEQR